MKLSAVSGSARFEPKARIIRLLGEELITSEIIAVFELVKNSYDACATEVIVSLENITDQEEGKISIKDNGTGMSINTILTAWLRPGTEEKRKLRENQKKSVCGRPILGEKGVGRFAAQKLGDLISITTRTKNDDVESIVEFDWRLFDDDKLLSEITIPWLQRKPKEFRDKIGTTIDINFLKRPWTNKMVEALSIKLQSLQSPFKEKEDFKIHLICNDFPDIKVEYPKKIIEQSIYKLTGIVDETGKLVDAEYTFLNKKYPNLKRNFFLEPVQLNNVDHFKVNQEYRPPKGKGFILKLYVWDLDPITLSDTITRKMYIEYIRPHTGIRLYRDDFRVWSYGEDGNDWLELDKRRVNNMSKALSNNQIIGIISFSSSSYPALKDKTDREGLVDSQEFEDFKALVLSAINQIEIYRRQDKSIIDNLKERKIGKNLDSTLENINNLKDSLKKDTITYNKYVNYVDEIEKSYLNYKNDIIEKLYISAGIGIAALMPAHEIQHQINYISPLIKNIRDNDIIKNNINIKNDLNNIIKSLNIMWDVADGALELTKKSYENVNLKESVEFALKVKNPLIKRNNIFIDENYKNNIVIKSYPNLISTTLLNIIDNSVWWLQQTPYSRKIKLTIKYDENKCPLIIVSDNGPGIRLDDLPFLGEAFYTRKPNGTGLGLYISKRAMSVCGGEIEFGFYPKDPDFLEGANVILKFKELNK